MKNILVAAVGMSPQVVTETIYGLWIHKITIDEIYVLTTAQSPVKEFLIQHLPKLSRYLKVKLPKFDSEQNLIIHSEEEQFFAEDIDSTVRSTSFTDLTCQLLFTLTSNTNTVVHCSLAGGRKTMSISMAVAMMLFGRKQDTLSHVIATKEFERSQKAYPTHQDKDQIKLIFVPYIRLRNNLPQIKDYGARTFRELVTNAQKELDSKRKKPSIKPIQQEHSVVFEGTKIKFQPLQYAFYMYLLEQKKVFVSKGFFKEGEFEKYCDKLFQRKSARSINYNIETFRKLRSEINAKIRSELRYSENIFLYHIRSEKENSVITYRVMFDDQ